MGNINQRIEQLLNSSPIFLFMKGTPEEPQCGFSARAVHCLMAVDAPFKSFNIFEDEEIRQGLKSYANFQTFPQLYINKKLVGGSDIVLELYESGELEKMVKEAK
ncbi:MAG: monothiol glutaredoxin, Grx4 family [Proteobacteria bacterium SG_bin7]|nr:MAG: monothiol glutaredoxin, Grx4 family [Proteobacteria bacterium SG_bin7]